MGLIRLDRFLTEFGIGSRTLVKDLIRKKKISVNGNIVSLPEAKVDPEVDQIAVNGEFITYQKFEYYMLNKPQGVVSAVSDRFDKTVVELITESSRKGLIPIGRLDKDTEGLMLITNDKALEHLLLSPKKHVDKTYYARIDGCVTREDAALFEAGMKIDDTIVVKPASLMILTQAEESEILLTIQEGKFHQVKKMFEAVGKPVKFLKRISLGPLTLDETLSAGEYRSLNADEIAKLMEYKNFGLQEM